MERTESSAVWIRQNEPVTASRSELADAELADLALAYGPLMPIDCWAAHQTFSASRDGACAAPGHPI